MKGLAVTISLRPQTERTYGRICPNRWCSSNKLFKKYDMKGLAVTINLRPQTERPFWSNLPEPLAF